MLMVERMTDLGYIALEAEDSAAGLQILQSAVPISLLISDIGLPGSLNGRQMTEVALRDRPALKVLFITGYAEHAAVRGGFLDSGMQMITKPFTFDLLTAKVREMIKN